MILHWSFLSTTEQGKISIRQRLFHKIPFKINCGLMIFQTLIFNNKKTKISIYLCFLLLKITPFGMPVK